MAQERRSGSLGITSQLVAVNPIVAQHDLQSFIHSRPKERRDLVSTALGLDELTALKTSIDGARKSFNLSPPAGVKDAVQSFNRSGTHYLTFAKRAWSDCGGGCRR
jgi:hypothetical protein